MLRQVEAQQRRNTALRKEIDELKLKLATEQANQQRLASLALSSAEATAQQGHITRMQMKARLEALQRHSRSGGSSSALL